MNIQEPDRQQFNTIKNFGKITISIFDIEFRLIPFFLIISDFSDPVRNFRYVVLKVASLSFRFVRTAVSTMGKTAMKVAMKAVNAEPMTTSNAPRVARRMFLQEAM